MTRIIGITKNVDNERFMSTFVWFVLPMIVETVVVVIVVVVVSDCADVVLVVVTIYTVDLGAKLKITLSKISLESAI